MRLAQRLSLPVVIHTRESIRDTLDMLREALARGPLAAGAPLVHGHGRGGRRGGRARLPPRLRGHGDVSLLGRPPRGGEDRAARPAARRDRQPVPLAGAAPRQAATNRPTSSTPPAAWRSPAASRSRPLQPPPRPTPAACSAVADRRRGRRFARRPRVRCRHLHPGNPSMVRTPSTMLPLGTIAPDFDLPNVDGRIRHARRRRRARGARS